ncbi:P-loop containing nucleoside triphosphate hydrolase protein [Dothidotthia symphoricarpi CBS 119687]|uniref:P-loop containing nucleoside triphosphate hydrolase protein n=1 Tax=Dothidotthia symphoricarpi CBS 119687 TaxID=1392245 RepID=A0A6A6AQB6_9PLEO|nr:P-loop containing nucleoside triphosphate hydrolase protein [Dothidotthia symphoricarpi CBS 119687]KAF2133736.1 P-loop containing nucleoside triphosphate hydrolase protein [Dothidotthia symphoricarpi CBS 119687]
MDYAALPPEIPEVTVLLLGDSGVGKSTFLSRLSLGIRPSTSEDLPPYSLPPLRDSNQPFAFDITLYARPYKLLFHDTASPTHYTLLHPSFVILCYDISSRPSLTSLSTTWLPIVNSHFNHDENLPVMVLGLKRDLRRQWTLAEVGEGGQGRGKSVMPHEGVQTAQNMLCDRYAECSAVTGELCRQVLEDVARTCAKSTTKDGAKSEGLGCVVM